MATLLIGTEVGEGMGHVAPWLDLCAQALQERHVVHMAGPDMRVLHQSIASRLPVTVWAAPKQLQQETITSALSSLSKALQSAARAVRTDRSTAAATTWSELHTQAVHRLVSSPPWLDHYEARGHAIAPVEHLGFLGLKQEQPTGHEADPGQPPTHIVGYLKANTPHLSQLLLHLASTGMPAQVYCPGQHRVAAPPGLEFSDTPLDLHHMLNPRTLFVTNGGLASVGLALQRRAHILLGPQQPEQVAMARRLHQLGLGTVALPESAGAAIDFLRQPRPDRPVCAPQTLAAESRVMRCVLGANAMAQ